MSAVDKYEQLCKDTKKKKKLQHFIDQKSKNVTQMYFATMIFYHLHSSNSPH